MKYGELPKSLGVHAVDVNEMLFYQYLPIKLANETQPLVEARLWPFNSMIGTICCDFVGEYGLDSYKASYIYLTAKNLWQNPNCEFNRPGWHSDGFLTNDINYIWCNNNPTTFNSSDFNIPLDHKESIIEMGKQAIPSNNIRFSDNELLRLNQFNIHKVTEIKTVGIRCFVKVSFSKEKYNLIGNSHNYLLDYEWDMQPRKIERNHPVA